MRDHHRERLAFAAAPSGSRGSAKDIVQESVVSSVSLFGMILRDHEDLKGSTLQDLIAMAEQSTGSDARGYRAEFIEMVKKILKTDSTRKANLRHGKSRNGIEPSTICRVFIKSTPSEPISS